MSKEVYWLVTWFDKMTSLKEKVNFKCTNRKLILYRWTTVYQNKTKMILSITELYPHELLKSK